MDYKIADIEDTFNAEIVKQLGNSEYLVKINDKNVWEGNIHSGLFNYTNIKEKFKIGYNTIEVISKKKNIVAKKRVFISFNQHIVIEFMPIHRLVRDKPEFEIWIRRGKFYYE